MPSYTAQVSEGFNCKIMSIKSQYWKNYYQKNKEKLRKYFRGYMRQWRKDNPEKSRNSCKKWASQNKEHKKIYNLNYYLENREKILKQSKEYHQKNREKDQRNKRKYYYSKERKDVKYRIDKSISRSINRGLNGGKAGRKWETLVGYTCQDLTEHLEKQFDENMSWENYGSYWEIDHIRPKSLFHFDNSEDIEFKECWALENLQPLEKTINKKKGNKLVGTLYN